MSYGKGQEGGKKEVRVPSSDKVQNISMYLVFDSLNHDPSKCSKTFKESKIE